MSMVLLLSILSFTIDAHYCGDTLVDMAIFKKAKSCGMEVLQSSSGCESMFKKRSCCTDKQIVHKAQDDLKDAKDTLRFDKKILDIPFMGCYEFKHTPLPITTITSFTWHPPPIGDKDFQVLYETFLI